MTVPTETSPPVPGCLVITRRAVGGDLGDREARVAPVGDLVEERVVAAGGLRAALDDVPGDDRAGQRVPVVAAPSRATTPPGPTTSAASVTRPATTTSAPRLQRRGDAPAAEVGVGGDRQARLGERLAGVEVGELVPAAAARRAGEQVVALDVGDAAAQAEPAGELAAAAASPAGLSPPALATTLMPRSRQVPSTCSIWREERARVAERRVLLPAPCHRMSMVSSAR